MMTTLDGFAVPVAVGGPENGVVVLILGDERRAPPAYDAICERLHTASLRTVVIGFDPRLTAKAAVGILDTLGIGWAVVVGDRAGGELAWELAATRLGRFVGLVVVDRGHPRVPSTEGAVVDEHCPPIEVGTTVLVSSAAARKVACDSQRFVYSDYRVVDLGRRTAAESTAQLAAEIVLRTSSW